MSERGKRRLRGRVVLRRLLASCHGRQRLRRHVGLERYAVLKERRATQAEQVTAILALVYRVLEVHLDEKTND